jgi:hypothetical protein
MVTAMQNILTEAHRRLAAAFEYPAAYCTRQVL